MSNANKQSGTTGRKTVRRSPRIQNLRRKLRSARRSRGSSNTCLPSIKRRRRKRSKPGNVARLLKSQNVRMCPLCGQQSRLQRKEEQNWLASSEGSKNAKVLLCEGKITLNELKEIVAADKKYYAITTNYSKNNEIKTCPISLETFKSGPYETIVLIDPTTNCQIQYDTQSLGEYLIKSGNRVCPVQRRKYSDKELEMIDEFLKQIGFQGGSVVDAINDVQQQEANKFRTEALTGLDNLIADCINEIFQLLEQNDSDRQTIFTKFLMDIAPNFEDLFFQLMVSDPAFAQICLEQYISRLSGPPNRPTKDQYKILPRILDFFKSKIRKKRAEFVHLLQIQLWMYR